MVRLCMRRLIMSTLKTLGYTIKYGFVVLLYVGLVVACVNAGWMAAIFSFMPLALVVVMALFYSLTGTTPKEMTNDEKLGLSMFFYFNRKR